MSPKFFFITGILTVFWLIFQTLLWGYMSLIGGIFDILFVWVSFSLIASFWKRSIHSFFSWVQKNSLIFWAVIGFFSIFLLICVYLANTFPTGLSRITLSDGKRTIVFVQMSHIATPYFYDLVSQDLQTLTASGYQIYSEWVRSGSQENEKKFQTLLGIALTKHTYNDIASRIGMEAQSASLFRGIASWAIENVDVSIDDIMTIIGTGKTLESQPPVDIVSEFSLLPNVWENALFSYIVRGMLNIALKISSSSDILLSRLDPSLMSAILDSRNVHIVDTYTRSSQKKSIFLYGALHFEGIYRLLREKDPKWNIIDFRPIYPYSSY